MKIESRKRTLRLRALALAGLAASGLSACRNDAAPGAPAPDSAVTTSVAAPAAAPAVAVRQPVRLVFSTDSPAFGSEVGQRTPGAGISASGKAGWLVFGPYLPLEPGDYEARVVGIVEPGHAGSVHVDVASEKGERVIAALELDTAALLAGQSPGAMVVLPFTLESAVTDLEVRIRVDEKSRLAVSEFQIRSKP